MADCDLGPYCHQGHPTAAHLLTHWMGQNARLLCSSIAWSRAMKLSCSRNARSVSRPATVSVKCANTGEKAMASSLLGFK